MNELKELFSIFLNKDVILHRKFKDSNNEEKVFNYKGKCIGVTETHFILDDFKKGTTVFFINEISVEPLEMVQKDG